ncbi:MAG: sensor domain-containing diguanylate cyclase, partial [Chitinophagaceae bacterium]
MNTVPAEITHQALLDAISITATGLAVLNAEKVVVFHNKHFAKMFGFGDQSLTGQHVNEITRLLCSSEIKSMGGEAIPIQEWLNTVIKKISTNQGEPFDIKLTNGNCLSISGQSQSNGNLVIACADITLQKQTELALHNAKQELQRLALTDELTGVSNRQYFMQQLEREINRSSRTHHPLCLAMVDIDFLKNINDNFGHAIGDKILMHFSQFLQTHFRASDIVGRLSSEEFAILL